MQNKQYLQGMQARGRNLLGGYGPLWEAPAVLGRSADELDYAELSGARPRA